jgi:hypothetical protein
LHSTVKSHEVFGYESEQNIVPFQLLYENCVERVFFFLKLEFELSKVDLFRNLLL